MNNESSYHFGDAFGKRHYVTGSSDAIRALSVVFVRRGALEHIHQEIFNLLDIVKPIDTSATR